MSNLDSIKEELEISLEEARLLIEEMEELAAEKQFPLDLGADIYLGQGVSWGIEKLEMCIDLMTGQGALSFFGITSLSYQHELINKTENIKKKFLEVKEKYIGEKSKVNSVWDGVYKVTYRLNNRSYSFDFESEFKSILKLIDDFIRDFFLLFLYFDNKNAPVIDNLIAYFNGELNYLKNNVVASDNIVVEMKGELDRVVGITKDIENAMDEASECSSKIKLDKSEIEEIRNEIELKISESREVIDDEISEIENKSKESFKFIDDVHKKCREFEISIAEKEELLASFEGGIDAKEEKYAKALKDTEALRDSLLSQDENVRGLVLQAESMLSSSTAAGLAHHFEQTKNSLDKELKGAKKGVWLSVLILAFLSVPLFLLVMAPIYPLLSVIFPDGKVDWGLLMPVETTSSWAYLGQSFSRAIVILPGVWLVYFSNSRYRSIFNLREHYSYKYTMAVSVEGFKKQAVGYESEIAAMVFEKIGFNPVEKLNDSVKDDSGIDDRDNIFTLIIKALRSKLIDKVKKED